MIKPIAEVQAILDLIKRRLSGVIPIEEFARQWKELSPESLALYRAYLHEEQKMIPRYQKFGAIGYAALFAHAQPGKMFQPLHDPQGLQHYALWAVVVYESFCVDGVSWKLAYLKDDADCPIPSVFAFAVAGALAAEFTGELT